MLNEKIFKTGTVEINYAEGPPSGPPLVLLHGLPGRWQEFSAVISILSQRFHIYALDGRGQGKSGGHPMPAALERGGNQNLSGCPDHGGGVHIMADGFTTDQYGGTRVRRQMGYGMDARHAGIYVQ